VMSASRDERVLLISVAVFVELLRLCYIWPLHLSLCLSLQVLQFSLEIGQRSTINSHLSAPPHPFTMRTPPCPAPLGSAPSPSR
jgi:hypothetical protein